MEVGGKYVHDIPWLVLEYEYEEDSRLHSYTDPKNEMCHLPEPLKLKITNMKPRFWYVFCRMRKVDGDSIQKG